MDRQNRTLRIHLTWLLGSLILFMGDTGAEAQSRCAQPHFEDGRRDASAIQVDRGERICPRGSQFGGAIPLARFSACSGIIADLAFRLNGERSDLESFCIDPTAFSPTQCSSRLDLTGPEFIRLDSLPQVNRENLDPHLGNRLRDHQRYLLAMGPSRSSVVIDGRTRSGHDATGRNGGFNAYFEPLMVEASPSSADTGGDLQESCRLAALQVDGLLLTRDTCRVVQNMNGTPQACRSSGEINCYENDEKARFVPATPVREGQLTRAERRAEREHTAGYFRNCTALRLPDGTRSECMISDTFSIAEMMGIVQLRDQRGVCVQREEAAVTETRCQEPSSSDHFIALNEYNYRFLRPITAESGDPSRVLGSGRRRRPRRTSMVVTESHSNYLQERWGQFRGYCDSYFRLSDGDRRVLNQARLGTAPANAPQNSVRPSSRSTGSQRGGAVDAGQR